MSAPPDLPPPLPAQRRDLASRAGRVALWTAGDGPPVLLVHSVNAAATAFEVRPIAERLAADHRVTALELPGFGASERGDRRYDIPLYVAAVEDAIDAVAAEADGPIDLLALSLPSEFAARAVLTRPARVRTLAMVTPTGLDRRSRDRRGPIGTAREVPGLHRMLSVGAWSQRLFDGLTSRASIAYFLRRTFGGPAVPSDLVEHCWRSARQPGARFAPLAFLCGRLFGADVRTVYERLELPVWVPHATRGDFRDFSGADWTASRPNWSLQAFETGALPHFEQPQAFDASYRAFLGRA
ncbi:MAG: alpha/beta hydrolase [Burkholderiales bacterium]|jgi:pimeloyl-ACP methyl ester carboxylesterase